MSSDAAEGGISPTADEKIASTGETLEHVTNNSTTDLVYDDNDEEPELHARTYIALIAMFILNMVQVVALQGPPAVVRMVVLRRYEPELADMSPRAALLYRI
jgi:hypothetical protein